MSLKKKRGSGLCVFSIAENTMLMSVSELTITPVIFCN